MAQQFQPAQVSTGLASLLRITYSHLTLPTEPLLPPDVILKLDHELHRNPFSSIDTESGINHLDDIGTLTWNLCTQLSRVYARNPNALQLLAKVRAIAFAGLNKAVSAGLLGSLRALDLALISARICLVNGQLDIALNILSTAAQRLCSVQPSHLGLDPAINRTLNIRYFLLRVRLAWLQNRGDIAELFFAKVPQPVLSKDWELIFDVCFIIGDSALALRQSEIAMTWLQRASDHLQFLTIATETTLPSFDDWNLVIRHSLAVACTQLKTPQAITLRTGEMFILRQLYPQHPAVDLLDLSIGHNNPSINELLEGLTRIVERTTLTDSNMPIIFQFARSLDQTGGLEDGIEALRILLMCNLPSCEWTEKCFVGFVLLLSRLPDTDSDCARMTTIRNAVYALEKRGTPSFSPSASHATMMSLWKMTSSAMLKQDYWTAQQWLLICTLPMIFHKCPLRIQTLIHKKLMACYLHTGNISGARELLSRGVVQKQSDCQRVYLSYKLNLLEGKDVSALFCLGFPSNPVPHKQLSILSCALEAQRQHKPEYVLSCLDEFIKCLTSDDIYHSDFSAAEHYLFAITLLSEELSKGFNQKLGKTIEAVLESALSYVKENSMFEGGAQDVSITQLQWLYFATYNIALKLSKSAAFQWTDSTLNYSKELALQYRRTAYPESDSKAPRPHLFGVAYLSLLAASLEARSEADPTKKRLYHESVRAAFEELDDLFGWDDGEEQPDDDAHAKEARHHDIAQFFDLEAALHLEQWDDVTKICESDNAFPKSSFYAPIMDLTLQLSLPPALAVKIIERIVFTRDLSEDNPGLSATSWQRSFRESLPRYFHCLFSLAMAPRLDVAGIPELAYLSVEMVDPEVAERVLDQVITMAEDETDVRAEDQPEQYGVDAQSELELYPFRKKFRYPTPELIKIATMAFNKACEFYRAARDGDCLRWANKAISVAELVPGLEGQNMVSGLRKRLCTMMGV